MPQPFTDHDFATLQRVVSSRRTFKVIGDIDSPVQISDNLAQRYRPLVMQSIKAADAAPFHYDRSCDQIAQPWRVTLLWHESCQMVASNFHQWFDDVKPGNKLPSMLSACGACVLVCWLPQFPASDQSLPQPKQIQIDQEHLAATSAYVQNLLLLLTAANMGTYWSSGGQFRQRSMMDRLEMPSPQQLLAAVFVEFPETNNDVSRLPGKLANQRSRCDQWLKVCTL
jgi:nitroreductase